MGDLFKTRKRESTVDIVIDGFRQLLISRKLTPGQRVPSENEISKGLGVSRGSVREAMKILNAFGVVEIKIGDGTYIPAEPRRALINPLSLCLAAAMPDIHEIWDHSTRLKISNFSTTY